MARSLDDYVGTLPAQERARIETRAAALLEEVEALAILRAALHRAGASIAPATADKMERRVDAYILALREALLGAGGTLDIVVRLPGRAPIAIAQFEGLLGGRSDRE